MAWQEHSGRFVLDHHGTLRHRDATTSWKRCEVQVLMPDAQVGVALSGGEGDSAATLGVVVRQAGGQVELQPWNPEGSEPLGPDSDPSMPSERWLQEPGAPLYVRIELDGDGSAVAVGRGGEERFRIPAPEGWHPDAIQVSVGERAAKILRVRAWGTRLDRFASPVVLEEDFRSPWLSGPRQLALALFGALGMAGLALGCAWLWGASMRAPIPFSLRLDPLSYLPLLPLALMAPPVEIQRSAERGELAMRLIPHGVLSVAVAILVLKLARAGFDPRWQRAFRFHLEGTRVGSGASRRWVSIASIVGIGAALYLVDLIPQLSTHTRFWGSIGATWVIWSLSFALGTGCRLLWILGSDLLALFPVALPALLSSTWEGGTPALVTRTLPVLLGIRWLWVAVNEERLSWAPVIHLVLAISCVGAVEVGLRTTEMWRPLPTSYSNDSLLFWRYASDSYFRARPNPSTKCPETRRVICMGGSTTFGGAIAKPEEAYPYVAERLLVEAGAPFEVLNAAVPGFSSLQGRLLLEHRLLEFDPDWVTISFGVNDSQQGQGPDMERWLALSRRPRWLVTLQDGLEQFHLYVGLSRFLRWGTRNFGRHFGAEADAPPRISPEEMAITLHKLAELGLEEGFRIVLLLESTIDLLSGDPEGAHPLGGYYRAMAAVAATWEHVELLDPSGGFLGAHRDGIPLFVDDCHLTYEGHGILGEALARLLLRGEEGSGSERD